MENQNDRKNLGTDPKNPGNNLNTQSGDRSDEENQRDSTIWPLDDTLKEYLEKDKSDSKMRPGSLHKE